MAIQSQPSRIPEPFAGSGTKNTIPATNATPSASQAASWASGFPPECSQPISAGGCPVPRNDVNGALNQLSQDFAFRQDGGIWEWSALADYDVSRVVRGSDGKIYYAVQQSGPSVAAGAQDPSADDGTYWTAVPLNDADVVHRSGNETISGQKIFTVDPVLDLGNPAIICKCNDVKSDGTSDSYKTYGLDFYEASGNNVFSSIKARTDANITSVFMRICKSGDISTLYNVALEHRGYNNNLQFYVDTDNYSWLGLAAYRWKAVYAATGTIQTSDERHKSSIATIPDEVLDAWGRIGFVQFQFNDAVDEKGSGARLHSGLVAQRIDAAFRDAGLDASRYGFFCYDSWEAEPEKRDEKGAVISSAHPAGDRYSIRYEEALCMEAAYQRRRADRAEARIAALEERLAAIEAKLNT